MKVLTIVGTRPELIRLSIIIKKLDNVCDHRLLFTNQNYDTHLSDIFFEELKIRKSDYTFQPQSSLGSFLGNGFIQFESILDEFKPDKVVVLGDTNTGLLTILATKRKIKVIHLEAGNRCYDENVPEEINRRIIDSHASLNLPYTENSKGNLIREGYSKNRIFKIGNPIKEVLDFYSMDIVLSSILQSLGLRTNLFVLLTLHRADNVDDPYKSKQIIDAINTIAEKITVVYPLHPRSKDQFDRRGISFHENVKVITPLGFFDFVRLEQTASVVISDSGTVPEECSLFRTPCIVVRGTTERQEMTENGSLILAGTNKDTIVDAYNNMFKLHMNWPILDDYNRVNVSDTVVKLVLGC